MRGHKDRIQAKDIPEIEVLLACRRWMDSPGTKGAGYQLAEKYPLKVVQAKMGKLDTFIEYGVSEMVCWLTPAGEERLSNLLQVNADA